jgi:hypothetical protein
MTVIEALVEEIEVIEVVRFEACARFEADPVTAAPVCVSCGWLDADHD